MQIRDTQRSKVYKSDKEVRKYGRDFESIPDVENYISKITKSSWWKKYKGRKNVYVGDGRARRSACADIMNNGIKLPKWARTEFVILHELAHLITYGIYSNAPAHGREFCKVYLMLVKRFKGSEYAVILKQSFKNNRVKYTLGKNKTHDYCLM